MKYNQEEKNIVREQSLKNAINSLTKNRKKSTLATKDYLKNAKGHLINKDNPIINYLDDETVIRWEKFYDSIVERKKPSDLKVAYLCGPNPLNDLQIMVEMGILPENVWAFEFDSQLYKEAVTTTLFSEFHYLKIINGKMETFFEHTPIKFDIIYFDACGPFPSKKSKTLQTIVSIFKNHKLNSPGALITNFSLPNKDQDSETWGNLVPLVGTYLYPKTFIETGKSKHNCKEGPYDKYYDDDYSQIKGKWLTEVEKNLHNYYGQYITRLISDIATIIVPYQRLINNKEFLKIFFNDIYKDNYKLNEKFEEEIKLFTEIEEFSDEDGEIDYKGGEIYQDFTLMNVLFSIHEIDKNFKDSKLCKLLIKELSISNNKESFVTNLKIAYYLLNQGLNEVDYYSGALKNLHANWKDFSRHYLCDVFLFHQIKELLVTQITVPYFLNIDKTKRWTYKAKETQMYTDLLIFDECRYIFDWMPTIDMLENNLDNKNIELSYRLILDAVAKHLNNYNNDIFYGTHAVCFDNKKYKSKYLKIRKKI
ncbi:MAG: hypothetical protein RBR70_02430 [Arcobacter sp.]|jgi:hypothetical protein|uniref:hypothetical protein n=1 Tax=Arcobacter sp. TaxID=1872629 RepID=UPI002A762A48|nr:hypothetical protein [Arcobacter sp.]MDY3203916.1 hypothetical protein [Arcobacter sp.]